MSTWNRETTLLALTFVLLAVHTVTCIRHSKDSTECLKTSYTSLYPSYCLNHVKLVNCLSNLNYTDTDSESQQRKHITENYIKKSKNIIENCQAFATGDSCFRAEVDKCNRNMVNVSEFRYNNTPKPTVTRDDYCKAQKKGQQCYEDLLKKCQINEVSKYLYSFKKRTGSWCDPMLNGDGLCTFSSMKKCTDVIRQLPMTSDSIYGNVYACKASDKTKALKCLVDQVDLCRNHHQHEVMNEEFSFVMNSCRKLSFNA